MGLANWLTVLRIVLIPVFVTLLVYGRAGAALLVFVAAAATDSLDGWVARLGGTFEAGVEDDGFALQAVLPA